MFVVISSNGSVNVTDNLEGFMDGADNTVKELPAGASTLAARYALVDGEIVDLYPTLETDEEVFSAIEAMNLADLETTPPVAGSAKLTKLAFMERFTLEEMAGIYTAAKTNVVVEIFLDKMKLAEFVDITDANTIAGVNALTSAGLLTEARAAEILAV